MPKFKKVKYKVGDDEWIGSVPFGSVCDVLIIASDVDSNHHLIYFPPKTKFTYKKERMVDKGCGSFSFARKKGKFYFRSYEQDYVNVNKTPEWLGQ